MGRKLTQAEIADALNISQRAYSKIENNEVGVKIDRLEKIAKLLDTDIQSLLPESPHQLIENVSYSQVGNGQFLHNLGEKERELYEKTISRQQEEIEYLRGLIKAIK